MRPKLEKQSSLQAVKTSQ